MAVLARNTRSHDPSNSVKCSPPPRIYLKSKNIIRERVENVSIEKSKAEKIDEENDDLDEPWPDDMEQRRLHDLKQWTLRNPDDSQARKVLAHLDGNEAMSSSGDEEKPPAPLKQKKKAVDRNEMNKWDDETTAQLLVAMNRFQESLNHMDRKGVRVSTHSRWAVISRWLPNQFSLDAEKFAMSCRAHFANLCRVYKGQKRTVRDLDLAPVIRESITEYVKRCAYVRTSRKRMGLTVEAILELMNSEHITNLIMVDGEMGDVIRRSISVAQQQPGKQADKKEQESHGSQDPANASCSSLSSRQRVSASQNVWRESVIDKSRCASTPEGPSPRLELLDSMRRRKENERELESRRFMTKLEKMAPSFQNLSRNNSKRVDTNDFEDFEEPEQDGEEKPMFIRRSGRRDADALPPRSPERRKKRKSTERPPSLKSMLPNEDCVGLTDDLHARRLSSRDARERACPEGENLGDRNRASIGTKSRLLKQQRCLSEIGSGSSKMPSSTCLDGGVSSEEYNLGYSHYSESSDPDLKIRGIEKYHLVGRGRGKGRGRGRGGGRGRGSAEQKPKTNIGPHIKSHRQETKSPYLRRNLLNHARSKRLNSDSDSLGESEPEYDLAEMSPEFLLSKRKRVAKQQKRPRESTIRTSAAGRPSRKNEDDLDDPPKRLVRNSQSQFDNEESFITGEIGRRFEELLERQMEKNEARSRVPPSKKLSIIRDEYLPPQWAEGSASHDDEPAAFQRIVKGRGRDRKEGERSKFR